MRKILFSFFAAICCSVVFWLGSRNLIVGLQTRPSENHRISFVYTDCAGKEIVCGTQSLGNGRVNFSVPYDARHFYFILEPNEKPYRIKAFTILGIPFFNSAWLAEKVKPRDDLHPSGLGGRGESLDVMVAGETGKPLDYVRFFDFLLHLYCLGRIGLIFSPFLLILGIYVFIHLAKIISWLDAKPLSKGPFLFLLVCLTMLSLPPPIIPVVGGLDPSWMWLLNKFALKPIHGSEAVFTYGPFGFLLMPQMFLSNVLLALCGNIIFFALWGVLVLKVFSLNPKAALLLLLTMLFPHDNLEWQWVMLSILCLAVPVCTLHVRLKCLDTYDLILVGCAGGLLPILSCVKFSSFVTIFTTQLFFLSYGLWMEGKQRIVVALSYFIPLCFLGGLICFSLFESMDAYCKWVVGSLQLASGYNKYMVVGRSWAELVFPFVVLAVYLCVSFWRKEWGWRNVMTFFLCSPFVFCTLKYAIVRQTVAPLFYSLAGCCALQTFLTPRSFKSSFSFSLLLLIFMVVGGSVFRSTLFVPSFRNCVQTVMLPKTFREVSCKMPVSKLPEDWLKMLSKKRIQAFPYDFENVMALTDVTIVPIPCFQLYSGYTPELDKLTAQLYESKKAPDFIVCENSAHMIDGRMMLLDNPNTMGHIQENYDCVAITNSMLLLKRRAVPLKNRMSDNVISCVVHVNEWFSIPKRATHFSISWNPTLFGRCCAVFLRNTQTFIRAEFSDGRQDVFRILPENMTYPVSFDTGFSKTMDVLWAKEDNTKMKPVRIRFEVHSPGLYCDQIGINLY